MTKQDKIKFGYLVSLTVALIVGVVLYAIYQYHYIGKVFLILDVILLIAGVVGFIILHNRITSYECSNCKKEFKASFLETIVAEDKGVNVGKKLTCPHCKKKDYSKTIKK